MDLLPDTRFADLLTRLRTADFRACTRADMDRACRTLGGTFASDGSVDIPGVPDGAHTFGDDDPYNDTESCRQFFLPVARIEPEHFRTYLDRAIAAWGEPSWYSGLSADLDVGWVDGPTLYTLELAADGDLAVSIRSTEVDANRRWWNWKTQYHYPEFIDEDEWAPTDEHDLEHTSADDYEIDYTWSSGPAGRGSEIWSVYTLAHLRGVLTDLLSSVHLAMRALGPGADPLAVDFYDPEESPDRHVRLELSLTEIRVLVATTEATRAHLLALGFHDAADGIALRTWPAASTDARVVATVVAVLLQRLGLGTEDLIMNTSGDPLAIPDFSVDLDVDLIDDDDEDE
ncbi:hypothetical protein [Nocardia caishijiensis]|nr:hypothetical protein [Nocardia caishijiensis]